MMACPVAVSFFAIIIFLLCHGLDFDFVMIDLLSDSTTGFDANSSLNTVYGEGKRVTGEFIQDVLHMGGIEMNDVQFGWAATYNPLPSSYFFGLIDTYGIMGVGPEMLEAGPSLRNETPYPNIISNLKRQKFIAAEAFSLFLNTAGRCPNLDDPPLRHRTIF